MKGKCQQKKSDCKEGDCDETFSWRPPSREASRDPYRGAGANSSRSEETRPCETINAATLRRDVTNQDAQPGHIVANDGEEHKEKDQTSETETQLDLSRVDDDEEQEIQDDLHPSSPREEAVLPQQLRPGAVSVRGPEYESSDQSTTGTIVVGDEQDRNHDRTDSTRSLYEGSHSNQDLVVAAEVAPTEIDMISKVEERIRQTENDIQRCVHEQLQNALQQTARAEVVPHETQNISVDAPVPIEESTMTGTTKSKLFWRLIAIFAFIIGIVLAIVLKKDPEEKDSEEGCITGALCSINHGDGICNDSGQCLISECEGNYDDCNRNANDGCETNLKIDGRHCGSCDNQCASGESCFEGICTDLQRLALMTFHESTYGSSCSTNCRENWGEPLVHECDWAGVECENGKVTSLEVYLDGWKGTIPTEIGFLTELTYLWFGYNDFTGTIPSTLGSLTKLKTLGLYTNGLTGRIPTDLGRLTNVELLWLYENHFTGPLPSEIARLGRLTSLRVFNNKLSRIPPEVCNMDILELEGDCPPCSLECCTSCGF